MTTTHGAQTPDQTAGGLPMTAAEFRIARESLGVSDQWLADHLGVSLRTMQRWGQGHSRLSLSVVERVEMLLDTTDVFVEAVVAELEADPDPDDDGWQWVTTYPTDRAYLAEHPDATWPASWHRAAMGRVAARVEGVRVRYLVPDAEDESA